MPSRSSLVVPLALAVLAGVTLLAAPASAQLLGSGGTTFVSGSGGSGGSSFSSSDFFLGVQATQGVNLTTFELPRFFNKAHCDCATPVYIYAALEPSGIAKRSTVTGSTGTVTFAIGSTCTDLLEFGGTVVNSSTCELLSSEPLLTFLDNGSVTISTNAQKLSAYLGTTSTVVDGSVTTTTGTTTVCTSPVAQFDQTLNMFVDFDGDGVPDLTISTSLLIDVNPPPQPSGISVQGGDEAIILKWDQEDTSVVTDLLGYQVLCSRADAYQVFKSGTYAAAFETCTNDTSGADAGVNGSTDGGVEVLNALYTCSGQLSPSASSYRVDVLQNDITYAAAVVAIDNSGNPSSPLPVVYGEPMKTLSFYDVYRDGRSDQTGGNNVNDPGAASGGYCAVAISRPRTTTAIGAIALAVVAMVVARRRRGRR
jgi:hypothetical protein